MKTGGHKGILCVYLLSLPVRGAWIEIEYSSVMPKVYVVSLPVRGAWIEIFKQFKIVSFISSLPVRGAWIEIVFGTMVTDICQSLPREERL